MAISKEAGSSFGELVIGGDNTRNTVFLCELCEILRSSLSPIQLQCCGTRLCQYCMEKEFSNSETFTCRFCQRKQPNYEMSVDRGVERELNMVATKCYGCSWNGSHADYLVHLQQKHTDLECSDCHMPFSSTNSYEKHRQETCEYRYVSCMLPGCEQIIKWFEMKEHYLSEIHQMHLIEFIIQYIIKKNHPSPDFNQSTNTSNISHGIQRISAAIQESMDILSPELATLSNDCARLDLERHQMNTMDPPSTADPNNLLLLDNDGSITFPFHIHRDRINSFFSMHSPTFKTSTFGYLFTIRVCSTPKSTNHKQDYLSIYITLLRTNFDPILVYPFPYNVTLSLCDQSGQEKDIKSTIKADSNPPAFPRPSSERNNEVCVTEFCPLNCLTDVRGIYYKDGVFFIRIWFDFMNI